MTRTLTTNVVPVIYVPEGVERFLPPKSYINVRDFKSAKHLAEYLLYLDKNDTAYRSYFEWKPHWDIYSGIQWVKQIAANFCKYLLENNRSEPKVIGNFSQWFFHNNGCKDPDWPV